MPSTISMIFEILTVSANIPLNCSSYTSIDCRESCYRVESLKCSVQSHPIAIMSGVERLAWNNQDIQTLAASWIKLFSEALENGDIDAFLQCIHPEGWFRDLLTFGWDFKTCHGHDSIRSYISKPLTQVRLYKVTFDPSLYGRPQASELGPGNHIIQAVIEFETPTAFGRGHVRLLYPEGQELPKAVTLLLSVSDWKGHEESGYESGLFDGHNLSWREVYEQRRDEIQRDPHVIICKCQ